MFSTFWISEWLQRAVGVISSIKNCSIFHFIPCCLHLSKALRSAALLSLVIKASLMFLTTPGWMGRSFIIFANLFFSFFLFCIRNAALRTVLYKSGANRISTITWKQELSSGINDKEKVELEALHNSDSCLCCRPRKASDLKCPTLLHCPAATPGFMLSCTADTTRPSWRGWAWHFKAQHR